MGTVIFTYYNAYLQGYSETIISIFHENNYAYYSTLDFVNQEKN